MRLDFVGVDPNNPSDDCPAVFVDPETGDFYMQGETVTDPDVLAWINSDSRIQDSESVVMLPAVWRRSSWRRSVAATSGAEGGSPLAGIPGQTRTYAPGEKEPAFAELIGACMVSAVHLEMHDQHMTSDPASQAWLAGESSPQEPAVQYRAYTEAVLSAVRRGVKVRRARIYL